MTEGASGTSDPAIRTSGLSRDFGDVQALHEVSLEVPAGIVFGFLGPNGSGKTTTIRLLLGLLRPSSGRAEVLGFDTRRQARDIRERSGALLEHSGLYERLSASENLEFAARAWRLAPSERDARIRSLLRGIGLWDRRDEVVGSWSRGMKQKLAVARTLVHRPALVFLDEPTAGLDPIASAVLREDLGRLAEQEGVTVFLTTHNLTEAERLCALVAVVRSGRLLVVAPPGELRARVGGNRLEVSGEGLNPEILARVRARPGVLSAALDGRTLHLQLAASVPTPPIVATLVADGVAIEEVRRGSADLEEAFLRLMETAEGEAPEIAAADTGHPAPGSPETSTVTESLS